MILNQSGNMGGTGENKFSKVLGRKACYNGWWSFSRNWLEHKVAWIFQDDDTEWTTKLVGIADYDETGFNKTVGIAYKYTNAGDQKVSGFNAFASFNSAHGANIDTQEFINKVIIHKRNQYGSVVFKIMRQGDSERWHRHHITVESINLTANPPYAEVTMRRH